MTNGLENYTKSGSKQRSYLEAIFHVCYEIAAEESKILQVKRKAVSSMEEVLLNYGFNAETAMGEATSFWEKNQEKLPVYAQLSSKYLIKKTNLSRRKLNDEILKTLEERGFVKQYENRGVKQYGLTSRGNELIYTWLDYLYTFDLRDLSTRQLDFDQLSEKGNSRLQQIIDKKGWHEPYYKGYNIHKRTNKIRIYRDFLMHLKNYLIRQSMYKASHPKPFHRSYKDWENKIEKESHFLKYSYIMKVVAKLNINFETLHNLKKLALKNEHIEIRKPTKSDLRNTKKHPVFLYGPIKELISITPMGVKCANTFDNIMMEYGLTDLV